MVCCCCLCCRRNRNGKENVDTGEMYSNQENQQRIVTSTASAGVHYPLQPYTSNSTEDISPTQLYPYSGQLNTVFQYGIKAPDQSFGATSLPPYEEPAPSYESVFGVACPSFTTQENILNTQVPRL
ncbi:uncharacterized protein LOC133172102 [Saccostrea echinata]|uniref:uncharacterized protein LOC133172102 n=1 Tax=Saccostrea echinata TaxID=191078 RepID=UPI002A81019F|nr:uncharacterized protein LOC133172102 [Saccostrea echinata]